MQRFFRNAQRAWCFFRIPRPLRRAMQRVQYYALFVITLLMIAFDITDIDDPDRHHERRKP